MQTFELKFLKTDYETGDATIRETRMLSFPVYLVNDDRTYHFYDGLVCEELFLGNYCYHLVNESKTVCSYDMKGKSFKSVEDCICFINYAFRYTDPKKGKEITAEEYNAQRHKVLGILSKDYTPSELNEPASELSTPTEQVDYSKTFEELENLNEKIFGLKVDIYDIVSKIDDFRSNNKAQALILLGELKSEINKVNAQLGTAHLEAKTVLNQFLKKETDNVISKWLNDWITNKKENGTAQD